MANAETRVRLESHQCLVEGHSHVPRGISMCFKDYNRCRMTSQASFCFAGSRLDKGDLGTYPTLGLVLRHGPKGSTCQRRIRQHVTRCS